MATQLKKADIRALGKKFLLPELPVMHAKIRNCCSPRAGVLAAIVTHVPRALSLCVPLLIGTANVFGFRSSLSHFTENVNKPTQVNIGTTALGHGLSSPLLVALSPLPQLSPLYIHGV
uniref:Sulfate_transp domain-containing protein n=1 Tax=Steinernema glaseri TaxID=37863 RepID=A0A1I7YS81_9BILA